MKDEVKPKLPESFDRTLRPIRNSKSNVLDCRLMFCKHILGVHRKSLNSAVMSEVGIYPLYIHSKLAMIAHNLRLRDHDNELPLGTIRETQVLESNWIKMVENDKR